MTATLHFRWLGVAGIELTVEDYVLAIDPFFTRPPFWKLLGGGVAADQALASEKVPRCHSILVTHAHYDHLMDAPALAQYTGAQVYGSANACKICRLHRLPEGQVHVITAGDRLSLGPFSVAVMPASHMRMPMERLVNGRLPPDLRPPLRLRDYRMDACFSFLIEAQDCRLLVGNQPQPAEVLFIIPLRPRKEIWALLEAVKPRLLIPIHWENFFSPLSKPIRPMLQPPWQPPFGLRRLNLEAFQKEIERDFPGARTLMPQIFQSYDLMDLLH